MSALVSLAAEIDAEHRAAEKDAQSAIEHARKAGELLIQAKAQIQHGGWLPWLAANVAIGERQAQKYMRLASSNTPLGSHLTINEALAAIAEPAANGPSTDHLEPVSNGAPTHHLENDLDPKGYGVPLDAHHALSAITPSGILVCITPDPEHPGFHFVSSYDPYGDILAGWSRPIKKEYVPACLDALNVQPGVLWSRYEDFATCKLPIKAGGDYSTCIAMGIVPVTLGAPS